MGVLLNIYCIPREPGSVPWSVMLNALAEHALVRPPYRAGTPFRDDSRRTDLLWPETWIEPDKLVSSNSTMPPRDFHRLTDALAYTGEASDAMIAAQAPLSSFHSHPDARELSADLAIYRFRHGFHFRVGVPQDFSDLVDRFPELANQSKQPKREGTLTEVLWLHGKCVPPEDEFVGSRLDAMVQSFWPSYALLADEFL